MQEICQSGSEGGGAGKRSPYLYFIATNALRPILLVFQRRAFALDAQAGRLTRPSPKCGARTFLSAAIHERQHGSDLLPGS